ncbi:MAG: hypothetical protein F7C36_00330 [Desulfurococcales archaeon]|nr:hypothetical protein [Desulfurococcales archaeon]
MSGGGFTTNWCREITCKYCGYTWCTRSKKEYVTCPRCQRKTPVYTVSINEVNKLFKNLIKQADDFEYTMFELIRVLIINYIREKRLKEQLLLELKQLLDQYTNHKKRITLQTAEDWW